jgi:hypothetical protein
VSLHPETSWHMILEVTTISPKEKPRDKNIEILQALEKLTKKIEVLNHNVRKLPDRPPEEDKKKYPFGYLMLLILTLVGGFIYMVNRGGPSPAPVGVGY